MPAAITVLGPVPGDKLGTTLMHEHLLIDFRARYTGTPETDVLGDELDLRDRWRVMQRPAGFLTNLVRNDIAAATSEVDAYVEAGGRTIVDATTVGLGPDPAGLRAISQTSGAHVVAATGFYVHKSHPDWIHDATIEEIAQTMVDDIQVADDDGIRRGFIGEIGVEGPTQCEMNVVLAAAIAQGETGAPVSIHLLSGALPEARPIAEEVVASFISAGGDPHRLILCHQDGTGTDRAHQDRLLELGVTLEFDTFGFESVFERDGGFVQLPTDTQRIAEIADLWERGWGGQVVLSQDVCYRMMSREWGGWGIAHIIAALPKRFSAAGLGEEEMNTMLVETPQRLLAFAAG